MERIWNLAAAVCMLVAFAFFWFHNFDGVFIAAVLGCVAWFLGYRTQTYQRVSANEPEKGEE